MEIIIARVEESIVIKKNDTLIEDYKLDKEVNFKLLVKLLLEQNLTEKIEIKDTVEEKTDAEENLIKIINEIIIDYNKKVDEYYDFIKDNEKIENN